MNDVIHPGDLAAGKTRYPANDRPYKPAVNPRYAAHRSGQDTAPEPGAIPDQRPFDPVAAPFQVFRARVLRELELIYPKDIGKPALRDRLGIAADNAAVRKRLTNALGELKRKGAALSNGQGRWRFVSDVKEAASPPAPETPPGAGGGDDRPPLTDPEFERGASTWETLRPVLIRIADKADRAGMSPEDVWRAFQIGYSTMATVKLFGARFPHDPAGDKS